MTENAALTYAEYVKKIRAARSLMKLTRDVHRAVVLAVDSTAAEKAAAREAVADADAHFWHLRDACQTAHGKNPCDHHE